MSDREPNYTALYIMDIFENSLTNYEEIKCLNKYQTLWCEYQNLLAIMHNDISGKITLNVFEKENNNKKICSLFYELQEIEKSATMQTILQKERNGKIGAITDEEYMQHKINQINKANNIQIPQAKNNKASKKYIFISLIISIVFVLLIFLCVALQK